MLVSFGVVSAGRGELMHSAQVRSRLSIRPITRLGGRRAFISVNTIAAGIIKVNYGGVILDRRFEAL